VIRFINPYGEAYSCTQTIWQWGRDDGEDIAIGDDTTLCPDYVSRPDVYLAAAFFGFMFTEGNKS
jgi:hypothetical protein